MKQSGSGSNQQYKSGSEKRVFSMMESMPSSNFYDPIIYRPQILDDPEGNPKKLTSLLFNARYIGRIKINGNSIEIQVKRRSERTFQKEIMQYNVNQLKDNQKNQDQKSGDISVSFELCSYLDRVMSEPSFSSFGQFSKLLQSMEGSNFMAWHLPYTKDGPRLRSLVLSKKSLSLMGFKIDEAAMDLLQFQEHSFQIFDNVAYRDFFLFYIQSLKKFMKADKNSGDSGSGSSQRPKKTTTNTMVGKNRRPITVQISMWMPNPFIVCVQIMKVLKRDRLGEETEERKQMLEQYVKNGQKSLQNVVTFKELQKNYLQMKQCGYVQFVFPENSIGQQNKHNP